MRRRCAGTSMRAALSNSTVSSSAMRPRSGVTRPAIMLTIEVLPAPDGPNSAVTPPVALELRGELKVAELLFDVDGEHRQSPW